MTDNSGQYNLKDFHGSSSSGGGFEGDIPKDIAGRGTDLPDLPINSVGFKGNPTDTLEELLENEPLQFKHQMEDLGYDVPEEEEGLDLEESGIPGIKNPSARIGLVKNMSQSKSPGRNESSKVSGIDKDKNKMNNEETKEQQQ